MYQEIDLLVEAEPDHSWDVQFVSGLDYQVILVSQYLLSLQQRTPETQLTMSALCQH